MRQFFFVEKKNVLITDMSWLVGALKCLITEEKFLKNNTHLKPFWDKYKVDAQLDKKNIKMIFDIRGQERSKSYVDNMETLIEVLFSISSI